MTVTHTPAVARLDDEGRMRYYSDLADGYGGTRVEERILYRDAACCICDQPLQRGSLAVAATIGRGFRVRVTYRAHPHCSPWAVAYTVRPERAWKAVQRAILAASSPAEVPAWALARIAPSPF